MIDPLKYLIRMLKESNHGVLSDIYSRILVVLGGSSGMLTYRGCQQTGPPLSIMVLAHHPQTFIGAYVDVTKYAVDAIES